jgi:hypothetical protein
LEVANKSFTVYLNIDLEKLFMINYGVNPKNVNYFKTILQLEHG